jgi:hypothetical protein
MTELTEVLSDVHSEVERARAQWGTAFDERNTLNDWITYINIYLGRAATMGASPEEVERNLRKAVGLAVSALCWSGTFAPRHYDSQQRPKSLPDIK